MIYEDADGRPPLLQRWKPTAQPVWVYDVPLNHHGNQAVSTVGFKLGQFLGQVVDNSSLNDQVFV